MQHDSDHSGRNPHKFVSDPQSTHSCEQTSVDRPELIQHQEGHSMEAIGLLVTLEARAGLANFLRFLRRWTKWKSLQPHF